MFLGEEKEKKKVEKNVMHGHGTGIKSTFVFISFIFF